MARGDGRDTAAPKDGRSQVKSNEVDVVGEMAIERQERAPTCLLGQQFTRKTKKQRLQFGVE